MPPDLGYEKFSYHLLGMVWQCVVTKEIVPTTFWTDPKGPKLKFDSFSQCSVKKLERFEHWIGGFVPRYWNKKLRVNDNHSTAKKWHLYSLHGTPFLPARCSFGRAQSFVGGVQGEHSQICSFASDKGIPTICCSVLLGILDRWHLEVAPPAWDWCVALLIFGHRGSETIVEIALWRGCAHWVVVKAPLMQLE